MIVLSTATSVITLIGMQLLARKRWEGWAVGLVNQVTWLALIVATRAWGLLLLTVSLSVTYTQGLIRWRREALAAGADS